jgi:hypothetical protein
MRDYFASKHESKIISGPTLLFLFANPYLNDRNHFEKKKITPKDCPLVKDILRYLSDHKDEYEKQFEEHFVVFSEKVGNTIASEISLGINLLTVGRSPSWLEIQKEDKSFRRLIAFSNVVNQFPKIARLVNQNIYTIQDYILNLEKGSEKADKTPTSTQRIFNHTKTLISKTHALVQQIAKRDKRLTELFGFAEHYLYPIPGHMLHSSPFLTKFSTTVAERAYHGISVESEHTLSTLDRNSRIPDLVFGQNDELNFRLSDGSIEGVYDSLRFLKANPKTPIHAGHFATLFYQHQAANEEQALLIAKVFHKMVKINRKNNPDPSVDSLNDPVDKDGFRPFDYAVKFAFTHHGGYRNKILTDAITEAGACSISSFQDPADPLPAPAAPIPAATPFFRTKHL